MQTVAGRLRAGGLVRRALVARECFLAIRLTPSQISSSMTFVAAILGPLAGVRKFMSWVKSAAHLKLPRRCIGFIVIGNFDLVGRIGQEDP